MYAELVGYGMSGDGHHVSAPPEDGAGARRAMMRALAEGAELGPVRLGYVNAHATSTPLGDRAELTALGSLLPLDGGPTVRVSSTKARGRAAATPQAQTGHLLGAAGAVESIFTVLALYKASTVCVSHRRVCCLPTATSSTPISRHTRASSSSAARPRHTRTSSSL
jgi:3-oxoacyl-[acyl-carrier-protein] synthase II